MNLTEEFEAEFNATETTSVPLAAIGFPIASTVGLASDLLLIFAIVRNRRMKSRRNVLLTYFAIFDALDFFAVGEALRAVVRALVEPSDERLPMCMVTMLNGLFKVNSALMMLLLVSTTIMRMHFITETTFQWCVGALTALIYAVSCLLCFHLSDWIVLLAFVFIYAVLVVVLLAKEVNACCKAYRDDPISDATKVKMNLARIYTYNGLLSVLGIFAILHAADRSDVIYSLVFILDYSLRLTAFYMLVYLCIVDENFKNAFRSCCKKSDATSDATVVYNADGNKETVDFTRI